MNESSQLLAFRLGEQRYALPLETVERAVRAVTVTPLPRAPAIVLGAINVAGRVLPVLNVRRRFQLPERAIGVLDHFLIACAGSRTVVLVVDAVEGVIESPASEVVGPAEIAPGLEQIQGVVKCADGLVLIHDLDRFLALDEARALDEAIVAEASHAND